jgi:uncharacterized protein involved in exopolysaccharide biosynthesis
VHHTHGMYLSRKFKMESNEKTVNGWNEHAKLVLNELKTLNARLDKMDANIESKFQRSQTEMKTELKTLEEKVNDLNITMAVLKKDVALKTSGIAFVISLVISVILKFLGKW